MDTYSSTLPAIYTNIASLLRTKGIISPEISLERPDDPSHGDMCVNIALRYAKELKQNPKVLAEEIGQYLSGQRIDGISDIQVVSPGFVNIFFTNDFFVGVLREIEIQANSFGKNDSQKGKKWVIEHTSPNPNKAIHLGHLRNNLVGMSAAHLLEWSGAAVVYDAIDNNRGIAIAKMMYGFLVHMRKDKNTLADNDYWVSHPKEWYVPEELDLLPDLFVTKCYTLGEVDFKNVQGADQHIRDMVLKWEANDENTWKLWSHVLSFSYQGMNRTLKRLGNRWDNVWHEHEHYTMGKEFVKRGLEKGVFKKLEDGAVVTNLLEYDIPDTILLKKDGTSLYITQDIALTDLKKKKFNADKLVWVIGPEQSLAMKQLFAVCEQLEIGSVNDFTHVSYGYVGLKDEDGKFKRMSSRAGTVVLLDDVIDAVKESVLQILNRDERGGLENKQDTAEDLALAAVKFSILKSDRHKDIAFDINQSVETKGDSGVYVLYTCARAKSILRKANDADITLENKIVPSGLGVARLLMFFPDIVKRSADSLSVHHVANFLLELCAAFNSWYAQEIILDGTPQQGSKLAIVRAVVQIIENGLGIMGIKVIEKV